MSRIPKEARKGEGFEWMDEGDIAVEEQKLDDVDSVADILVHEGKHAQGGSEADARREEQKLYEEQREHGHRDKSAEEDRKAIQEGRLPQHIEDIGYPHGR